MASETPTGPAGGPATGPVSGPGTGPVGGTSLQVLRRLGTGPRGLTDAEAAARLATHGENAPPRSRTPSVLRRCLRGLRDPFTTVLLTLGLVSAFVASWGTATVILALVAVSCALRAAGERRADRALAALRELVAGTATVLRRTGDTAAPRTREVPVADLVPGDVVRLGPGDLVPADVRLLRARGLTVSESALTGESAPVAKAAADPPEPSAESPLCFQGSAVVAGSATAVVVATGADTRFAAAQRTPEPREPSAFDRSVHGIAWVLVRFMLLTPPLVLMAGAALRGRGLQTLPFAVSVAVGLTPEMLPVIVTTCLARSAALLARTRRVVVRRLPALHDLGAVDVLCVDKTGTLTQDRPVAARSLGPDGRDDPEVLRWAAVGAWWTLQLAELPAPDALDEALLDVAGAVGEEYDGLAALPVVPGRRLATAVVAGRLGHHLLITKGAAEDVLERCDLPDAERQRLLALAAREAESGQRVLAVATAERPARTRPYTPADERGLAFRGLVTFHDELAPGAAESLRTLAALGIQVHVLTGDHPATAARVCREAGLEPGEVRTAGGWSPDAADGTTTVVARCTPEDKARVVAGLRAAGHTVGFLGDGVNDVAALLAADVGIAPRGAVAVARESADVVLAEKDLTAIGHAVTAGRIGSANIAAYLRVTLSSNLGNVLAMLAAGLLLPFLPMLPVQVLAQNLCFDAAQLAFAHDRPAPSELRRPTVLRPPAFLRFITGFGVLNAFADLATFEVLALALNGPDALDDEAVFHSAWFTENLLTQALVMLLLRDGRRLTRGGRPGPVGWAAVFLAAVGLAVPPSPLGAALGMTALPAPYHLLLAAVLGLYALALIVVIARHARCRPQPAGCTVAQNSKLSRKQQAFPEGGRSCSATDSSPGTC
ncbi:cation-translocating P-type ATPase [Streptomyces sp. NPDC059680]|uniref:cation-translocating P-type ATPase n=1 Tax=Streptomyces TaxID=1883 RepID=UPI001E55B478|nr:HAD-IC family P-type ATPase [Streptomyces barringtoniae]MCC5473761.1 HAD-IC family P-type ATPase [Streptomyces barringtoniae]